MPSKFVPSANTIWKKNLLSDSQAAASIKVGLVFTFIGLFTDMIWARIIWGIWWTWDPRLTCALITFLIYAGLLMKARAHLYPDSASAIIK